jgi:hypothetical protein
MDLLNRGPERALELDGALAVTLVPGHRPTARMLSPDQVIAAVLQPVPAGTSLELLAAQVAARPVATRLARMAAVLRDAPAHGPAAVEAGGQVFLAGPGRLRRFSLRRFAARPRVFTPDAEAPDLSATSGGRQGFRSRAAGVVECRVVLVDTYTAAILYADDTGAHLREEVPVGQIEERLRDAREIVRTAAAPAVLAVRLADEIEAVVRRAGPPGARVGIVVGGTLPSLEVHINEERFGGERKLGWRAAAEALLAQAPAGGESVVVGVDAVVVTVGRTSPSPLLALYASSVARRRLGSHLVRAMASYRLAWAGRRET